MVPASTVFPGKLSGQAGGAALTAGMFRQKAWPTSEKIYTLFAALFVMILVLTNIIGTKLFALEVPGLSRPLVLTTGILTYPLTFWFTDIVSELWGKRRADLMVFYGFLASLIMLGILWIARAVPPAEIWTIRAEFSGFFDPAFHIKNASGAVTGVSHKAAQVAYSFTFDAPGTLLFASMLAYLCAQLSDNYLFHFWRRLTNGKHLWLRNNGSTAVSQLLDTIIVNGIFLHFYWNFGFAQIVEITIVRPSYSCSQTAARQDRYDCLLRVLCSESSMTCPSPSASSASTRAHVCCFIPTGSPSSAARTRASTDSNAPIVSWRRIGIALRAPS